MITIITRHGKPCLKLVVGSKTKVVVLPPADSPDFFKTVDTAHVTHQQWVNDEPLNLASLLFKDGVPQYIHLTDTSLQLRFTKDPLLGVPLAKPVLASASISRYGLDQAFEIVWTKLSLTLGLFESSLATPLKAAALSYFKMKRIYK